jgi:hypothetical protein
MKRKAALFFSVSALFLMMVSIQGCVVPYFEDVQRPDHRGPGPGPGPGPGADIRVVSGTYGGSCGAPYGNATSHLLAVCDGKRVCDYIIDYRTLGDPAPNCPKDYVAEWRCGSNPKVFGASVRPEAGTGRVVRLRCQ